MKVVRCYLVFWELVVGKVLLKHLHSSRITQKTGWEWACVSAQVAGAGVQGHWNPKGRGGGELIKTWTLKLTPHLSPLLHHMRPGILLCTRLWFLAEAESISCSPSFMLYLQLEKLLQRRSSRHWLVPSPDGKSGNGQAIGEDWFVPGY